MSKVETYADWTDDYPCAIVTDRYGGTYSGGRWVAYPLWLEDVPPAADGNDTECVDFWFAHAAAPAYPVGLGADPAAALDDLRAKARGERDWRAGNQAWRGEEGSGRERAAHEPMRERVHEALRLFRGYEVARPCATGVLVLSSPDVEDWTFVAWASGALKNLGLTIARDEASDQAGMTAWLVTAAKGGLRWAA